MFTVLPWSTVRVLLYIAKCHKNKDTTDALLVRKHFNFPAGKEQMHLELLHQTGFITNVSHFADNPSIYQFQITAKGLIAGESFAESVLMYLMSSFVIPALVAVVVSLVTLSIKK